MYRVVKIKRRKESEAKMTKSYHDLESYTCKNVSGKNLCRMHGKPTWRHKEDLLLKAGEVILDCVMHYDWSGDFGLLTTIIGLMRYTAKAGFN